jgi:hypothetical protein
VLTVVEHHDGRSIADAHRDGLHEVAAQLALAERSRDRGRDSIRVVQRGELDEPGTTRVRVEHVGGKLQREARLAAPARAGDRQDPSRSQEPAQVGELLGAADEACQLHREVVRQILERRQRRVAARHLRVPQLEDPFGPPEVLQPVQAEVGECRAAGRAVTDEVDGRARDEHLAADADRAQPSATNDRGSEVVALVAEFDLARVDGHPHRDRRGIRPRLGLQSQLCVACCGERVRRERERRDDAVPFSLLDRSHAVVVDDRLVEDLVVPRDRGRGRIGIVLPPPRGTFHVGQQEGHRANGKQAGWRRRPPPRHALIQACRGSIRVRHAWILRPPDPQDIP